MFPMMTEKSQRGDFRQIIKLGVTTVSVDDGPEGGVQKLQTTSLNGLREAKKRVLAEEISWK